MLNWNLFGVIVSDISDAYFEPSILHQWRYYGIG